jgi:glycerophosphoryl diester phosphodiesterase
MRKLVVLIGLVSAVHSVFSVQRSYSKDQGRVEVYAHRGVRSFAPENTLPAYEAALKIGADWVDMDVVLTKDGEVLVSHDPVLNPNLVRDTSGKFLAEKLETLRKASAETQAEYTRKYTVKNLTLGELRRFDVGRLNRESEYSKYFPEQVAMDGTRMPTLSEVIQLVKKIAGNKVGFQIEMKTDPAHPEYSADPGVFAKALYGVLKKEGISERTEIQAFDFRCLYELQRLDKRLKTAYLTSRENERGGPDDFYSADPAIAGLWTGGKLVKDYGGSIPKMVKALGGYAWEPEDFELNEESLRQARELGLKVVVWSWPEQQGTAFDSKTVERMIHWGVDGIITDDPGHLNSMLAARGFSTPLRYSMKK